jgi:hypothetical protein
LGPKTWPRLATPGFQRGTDAVGEVVEMAWRRALVAFEGEQAPEVVELIIHRVHCTARHFT